MLMSIGAYTVTKTMKAGGKVADGFGTIVAILSLFFLVPAIVPVLIYDGKIPKREFTANTAYVYFSKYLDIKLPESILIVLPMVAPVLLTIFLGTGFAKHPGFGTLFFSSIGYAFITGPIFIVIFSILYMRSYYTHKEEIRKLSKLSKTMEEAFSEVMLDIHRTVANHYYSKDEAQLQKELQPIITKVMAVANRHTIADKDIIKNYILYFKENECSIFKLQNNYKSIKR